MRRELTTGLTVLAVLLVGACGDEDEAQTETRPLLSGEPSILLDLDPSSSGTTFTVENITANASGALFVSDRESGNVLRVDPRSPAAEVVGRLEDRTDAATDMPVKANGAGLVFTPGGDLLIASGAFGEVLRLAASDLEAATPVAAQTAITGATGANGLLLDGDDLFISGGNTGNVYVAPVSGGAAEVWAVIEPATRAVPPNDFMQSVVSNGMARAPSGALLVADTARGAIWQIPVNTDGSAGTPAPLVQDALLEGIDGISYDSRGKLWAAVNERNALVVIGGDGPVEAYKNGNTGPLEFPAALVFVGDVGYVVNFDRPRRENLASDGTTSSAGIGSSIARFSLPTIAPGTTQTPAY